MPTIVVAGGGIAGHSIASALQEVARVVLIDPKDHLEIPMAAPRLLARPGSLDAWVLHSRFLSATTRVQARLLEVGERVVTVATEDGRRSQIWFDFLVLATGAADPDRVVRPATATAADAARHFSELSRRLRGSPRLLIVGGGPVGVEVAAELAEVMPRGSLILIEAGERLLPVAKPRLSAWAADHLQRRGVAVRLGQRLEDMIRDRSGIKLARTAAGSEIEFDAMLLCNGTRPDASYLRERFPAAIDDGGRIRVDANLRVRGLDRVFAAGDASDADPLKLAAAAERQAAVVLANLRRLLVDLDTPAERLAVYRPAPGPARLVVSLGPDAGLAQLRIGCYRSRRLARILKSRDMLTGRYQRRAGSSPPN